MLDMEVKTMVAIEVAMAACTTNSLGTPKTGKSMVRKGTSNMPPPIPSSPAANPTTAPKHTKLTINIGSMKPCEERKDEARTIKRRHEGETQEYDWHKASEAVKAHA